MLPNSILVVDDSKVQCQYAVAICRLLAPDAEIRSCHNGAEAVAILRERSADVVVMDLEMPVMDGVALANHIADEHLAKGIVICSSKDVLLISSVGTMSEANGLTVLGTLQKPIQCESLQKSFDKFNQQYCKTIVSGTSPIAPPKISELELFEAINGDKITLHFQPKLTTNGLLLKGVEVLARWEHPTLGFIPPDIFIALAEKTMLIDQLTVNLLAQALVHMHAFDKRGLNLSISFNLSPQSINNPKFIERLVNQVKHANVDPNCIIFEITENMLMLDVASSLHSLALLRLGGFHLSIDDFGSGFSNAEQLACIPATELKIDRSLVNGASKKWQQFKILESTVCLAQSLNLVTVAEGVEEYEDFEILLQLGVDIVQGYHFAKPMSPDSFFSWVDNDLTRIRSAAMDKQNLMRG